MPLFETFKFFTFRCNAHLDIHVWISRRIRWNTNGNTLAQASVMCRKVLQCLWRNHIICYFKYPHREKSSWVRSGERGGQSLKLLYPITWFSNSLTSYYFTLNVLWTRAPSYWNKRFQRLNNSRFSMKSGITFGAVVNIVCPLTCPH